MMRKSKKHPKTEAFLSRFQNTAPVFYRELDRTVKEYGSLFYELSEPMLFWASHFLGEDYEDVLVEGYCEFVYDVNKSQAYYEKKRKYEQKKYEEIYSKTYASPDFMSKYHWGVYVTTFAWGHHLKIYKFYRDEFLARLTEARGIVLDLGSGSGIWHLLALERLQNWTAIAVDISETSVNLARKFAGGISSGNRVKHTCENALTFTLNKPADAGISCFLLEHLEQPISLLDNLARNVKERAYAFITCAITAAEIDHIYEFKRESEILLLAEKTGFRVVAMLSSSPKSISDDYFFLPRSLALLVQKKRNDIW